MALFDVLGSMPRKIERASLITSGSSGGLNAGPPGAPFGNGAVSTANEVVINEKTKTDDVNRISDTFRHENIMLEIIECAD